MEEEGGRETEEDKREKYRKRKREREREDENEEGDGTIQTNTIIKRTTWRGTCSLWKFLLIINTYALYK